MLQYADHTEEIELPLRTADCLKLRHLLEGCIAETGLGPTRELLLGLVTTLADSQYLAWWKREQVCLVLTNDEACFLRDDILRKRPHGDGSEVAAEWKQVEDALFGAIGLQISCAVTDWEQTFLAAPRNVS